MNPLKIYDYLIQMRERVFDAIRTRPLTAEQYHQQFPIGLKSISRTLTHVMICEWAYVERLEGREMPPYETWPIQDEKPPAFVLLEKTWREQAPRTRAAFAAVDDWDRPVYYKSHPTKDGKQFRITTTPMDLLMLLHTHEVHHRAQVMAMLRELGSPLQDLDWGYFAHTKEEIK